jgi:hypothetical protein
VEQSGDFSGGHPYIVTGYADRLVLNDDYVTFHGFSVLDGTTCKFFDLVQSRGKVLHVLIELLFGYFRVYLRCLYAFVSQHGTDRFDGYAVGEEHRRGGRVAALMPCNMLGDTATLGDGVPIETVSSMLGHKSIKTTQIYAKITKEKLNQDMENLAARLNQIEEFAGRTI